MNVIGSAALRPAWTSSSVTSSSSSSSSASSGTASSSSLKDLNKFNDPAFPYQITVVSGRSVTIRCPVIAYPIESLQWQHRSTQLPNNHRQKVDPVIGGVGGKLFISNVHRENDQGEYSCTVKVNGLIF